MNTTSKMFISPHNSVINYLRSKFIEGCAYTRVDAKGLHKVRRLLQEDSKDDDDTCGECIPDCKGETC